LSAYVLILKNLASQNAKPLALLFSRDPRADKYDKAVGRKKIG